jgi:predicted small metal-binding protein
MVRKCPEAISFPTKCELLEGLGKRAHDVMLPSGCDYLSANTSDILRWAVGGIAMEKIIECAQVDPSSGCKFVVRGKDEAEVLKNAMEHAKLHGIREVTPELKAKVKAAIRDAN